jgi:hypothetical protein
MTLPSQTARRSVDERFSDGTAGLMIKAKGKTMVHSFDHNERFLTMAPKPESMKSRK